MADRGQIPDTVGEELAALADKAPPRPVDGYCPACGKSVALALRAEPPQWACIDIDCVHGGGHPLPRPAVRSSWPCGDPTCERADCQP